MEVARPRPASLLNASILFAVLTCVGCGKSQSAQSKKPPPTVTVAAPVRRAVNVYRQYVGQLASPQTVDLRARVDGFIKEINYADGSIVKADTLMFVIDPAPYEVTLQSANAQLQVAEAALLQAKNAKDIEVNRANVAKAEAGLRNSQQKVKDNQVAFSEGAVPREQLDNAIAAERQDAAAVESAKASLTQSEADYQTRAAQAEAQVAVSRAAVATAQLNLGYTRVTAPITGRAGISQVHKGSLVQAAQGTLLATISQTDPVWVYFSISEREEFQLHKLHEEKKLGGLGEVPAQMVLADGSLYPEAGVISAADRALDPNTGTLTLRADFPNPDQFLRPGNYAKVRILTEKIADALLVPAAAIGTDQAGAFVLVVSADERVERRSVQTGVTEGEMLQITHGLTGPERIITNGQQRARPGAKVTPVPEAAPEKPDTRPPDHQTTNP
ncbi:MAG TPA: efflux RND transporter periplasmic adaptor subunit [Planctomycetota bacterium]|jgi:RND family efflux transporter MFP subunit